jgi:hypothetical protein
MSGKRARTYKAINRTGYSTYHGLDNIGINEIQRNRLSTSSIHLVSRRTG